MMVMPFDRLENTLELKAGNKGIDYGNGLYARNSIN